MSRMPVAAEVTRPGLVRQTCIALLLITAIASAETTREPAEAPTATAQHAAQLNALDAAIGWFEKDLARVKDPGQHARIELLLQAFKQRRDTLRKGFDPVKYDELRFELNVEYQRLGMLLAPPATPRPATNPAPPPNREIADLGLVLVPIPAGTFMMGRTEGTAGAAPDEMPETRVTFTKPFWIAATEVSVRQWRQFVAATGYRTEAETHGGLFVAESGDAPAKTKWKKEAGLSWSNPGRSQSDAHPVVGVSWNDALKFCAWLTERERAGGRLLEGYAYTLPTEAQWEHACRAGNHGPDAEQLDDWAWHAANSGGGPRAVATRRPNVWGFYDMQGNVAEWCLDSAGAYTGKHRVDLRGAVGTEAQVRGGSALSPAGRISSTQRSSVSITHRRNDLGFRIALSATP